MICFETWVEKLFAWNTCEEPGKRSRLWLHGDVLNVLANQTGTEEVKGLILELPRSNDVEVNGKAFAQMNRLRLLKLNYVHLTGSYEHLSKRLRWLCWFGFPLKSIPSNLFIEEVVVIDMRYSNLKRVWKGRKILRKLKILNLSHSYHLTETTEFSGLTSLETLLINDCTKLIEVHQSVECLDKLLVLNLKSCKNLRKLPIGICNLKSLQNLNLSGCSKLEKLLGFEGSQSQSWYSLFSFWESPVRNADSISLAPASTQGLISLSELNMADCNLSYVPDELGSLTSLKHLNLKGNNICNLPSSIRHLSRLWELDLNQCTRLQSLPELPENLKWVCARHCTSLERVSIGSDFRKSPFLTFYGCHKLIENNFASNFRNILLQNQVLCVCVLTRLFGLIWRGFVLIIQHFMEQELSAVGKFSILLPGGEVPDYFNHQSVGFELSIVVSLLPNQKIRGWTLCVVLEDRKDEMVIVDNMITGSDFIYNFSLSYEVENKTKGSNRRHEASFHDFPLYNQDHIWLHYVPHHHLGIQIEAENEVACFVFMNDHTHFQVKKWGINMVYEDAEEDVQLSNGQAMVQYALPSYRDVNFDEDISGNQAVGHENKIVHCCFLPGKATEAISYKRYARTYGSS